MGMLAIQGEIGVWVQAPAAHPCTAEGGCGKGLALPLQGSEGITHEKKFCDSIFNSYNNH